jgi:predicted amidohydrolase
VTAPLRAACIQLNSGREFGPNLDAIAKMVRDARADGCTLIFLPENAAMLEPDQALLRAKATDEDRHTALAVLCALARDHDCWLVAGSLAIALAGAKVANRSFVIDPTGAIVARYDKIHLFDVELGAGEQYRESAVVQPGAEAVTAATPWGRIGLSICYDLRFPALYRHLARAGADFLSIPAAFTRTTGEAHWHVLVRARAIENGCFVFAAAQCGIHAEGRRTFGHALIVDPWGRVLADAGEAPGIISAEIDPALVTEARRRIPALAHERPIG